jgi:hypothetical protein
MQPQVQVLLVLVDLEYGGTAGAPVLVYWRNRARWPTVSLEVSVEVATCRRELRPTSSYFHGYLERYGWPPSFAFVNKLASGAVAPYLVVGAEVDTRLSTLSPHGS